MVYLSLGHTSLLLAPVTAFVAEQLPVYGHHTTLAVYSQDKCPITEDPVSLTPTSSRGNCTNLIDVYAFVVKQRGLGYSVQYFMVKDCPTDKFAKHAYWDCNTNNGYAIESVQLVDCEYALPDPISSKSSQTSTKKTDAASSKTSTSTSITNSHTSVKSNKIASSSTSTSSKTHMTRPVPPYLALIHSNGSKIGGIIAGVCVLIAGLLAFLTYRFCYSSPSASTSSGLETDPLLARENSTQVNATRPSLPVEITSGQAPITDVLRPTSYDSEATEGPSARLQYLEKSDPKARAEMT